MQIRGLKTEENANEIMNEGEKKTVTEIKQRRKEINDLKEKLGRKAKIGDRRNCKNFNK